MSTGGRVETVALQGDGKLVIGGLFTKVNDVSRTNIARLNPNGNVDLTFNPIIESFSVDALAIDGTNIYVAGAFSQYIIRRSIKRISTVNGAIDDWGSENSGFETQGPPPLRALRDPLIKSLLINGTDIYVAGSFNSIGGIPRNNLAKISTLGNGVVDLEWNPNPDAPVNDVRLFGSTLFVAGEFSTIGGEAHARVTKLSTTGAGRATSAWNPRLLGETVEHLALTGEQLYLAGTFTNVGGISRKNVARVSAVSSGSVDPVWNVDDYNTYRPSIAAIHDSVFLSVIDHAGYRVLKLSTNGEAFRYMSWNATFDESPTSFHLDSGGVIVSGEFKQSNGEVSLGLTKLNLADGAKDPTFGVQVQIGGTVHAIAKQADGKVIVGGDFWFADGLPRQNLMRLDQTGNIDKAWSPDADGIVYALAVSDSDVLAGGAFHRVGGVNRTNIAKIALVGSDAVDLTWNLAFEGSGVVRALALGDTALFVGGTFDRANGYLRSNVLKCDFSGRVDPVWNCGTKSREQVLCLSLSGTNLYIGGAFTTINGIGRTNLAKVSSIGSGSLDTEWNASIVCADKFQSWVRSLDLAGSNLFVGGWFTNISGFARSGLAKVDAYEHGSVDRSWSPLSTNYGKINAVAVDQSLTNLYVAGVFGSDFEGKMSRLSTFGNGMIYSVINPAFGSGNALVESGRDVYFGNDGDGVIQFYALADAPKLYDATSNLVVLLRNIDDGPEISHFRITGVTDGMLFDHEGLRELGVGDFVTVAEGASGLTFIPSGTNGMVTAVSALNATPAGAGTAETRLEFSAARAPIFSFETNRLEVQEGPGVFRVTVRKRGVGSGEVFVSTRSLTARDGLRFQPIDSLRLPFAADEVSKDVFVQLANDFIAQADETLAVRLHGPSAGTSLANPAELIVTLIDDDNCVRVSQTTTQLPTLVPLPERGSLQVILDRPLGQWRLVGEPSWHDGGAIVQGLHGAVYTVEFKPLPNLQAPGRRTLLITAGTNNILSETYVSLAAARGHLSIKLGPSSVLDAASPAAWRLQGETNWHLSGAIVSNLNVGEYLVEFRPVSLRATPRPHAFPVSPSHIYGDTVVYPEASGTGGTAPAVLGSDPATTTEPYVYNGQIEAAGLFGSGVVVGPRTVLTAAHVVFDDRNLRYINSDSVRWFHRRYRQVNEPAPQTPRGWYIFRGYADQRISDNSPDVSSSASQQLDAAVIYFINSPSGPNLPGGGGYGGYLVSEGQPDWLLSSSRKMLVGYPVDDIPSADQGRLHATVPMNSVTFTPLYGGVYETTALRSSGGNSGGPLYVEHEGRFYPAGIYLGGFSRTLVKSIDCRVADLINRAEVAANGDGNSTGGGVTFFSSGTTVSAFDPAYVTVLVEPADAVRSGGGWRIVNIDSEYRLGKSNEVALVGLGSILLNFKAVSGYETPQVGNVELPKKSHVTVIASYGDLRPRLSLTGGGNTALLSLAGQVGTNYIIERTEVIGREPWSPLTNLLMTSTTQSFTIPLLRPARSTYFRAIQR